jgi:cytochrome oxidase Cu insertion factor (SCO1/SenC/PrrC family)
MKLFRFGTLALAVAAAGCAQGPRVPDTGAKVVGKAAPDFTLTSLAGQKVSLSEHRGKIVLLAYWAVG